MHEPKFLYLSTCCQVQGTKPPCVKVTAQPKFKGKKGKGKRGDEKPKAPEFSTLGRWRCGQCGKPCKVSVMPRPPKEEKPAEVPNASR